MFKLNFSIFQNSLFIKILSLIISINFWIILSNNIQIRKWIDAKVIIYNLDNNKQIKYNDNIKILVYGNKLSFYFNNNGENFVYINYNELNQGKNIYKISDKNVYLSNDKLNIINYYPEFLEIDII